MIRALVLTGVLVALAGCQGLAASLPAPTPQKADEK